MWIKLRKEQRDKEGGKHKKRSGNRKLKEKKRIRKVKEIRNARKRLERKRI